MGKMPLMDQLRLQEVKRFGIMHVNREQSVAEHSFNVLLIAMDLASCLGEEFAIDVMVYAIHHDMEEVYTGDIPSSFKRQLRAECPSVTDLLDGTNPGASLWDKDVKATVKLADWLECIYYLKQFGGSRHTMSVLPELVENFNTFANTCGVREEVRHRAKQLLHEFLLERH